MSWIIGAVAIYCIFAAALIILLSVFSSRLSRQEAWEEVWEVESVHDTSETKTERYYSHLSSRA